jgi:hypothetical protein
VDSDLVFYEFSRQVRAALAIRVERARIREMPMAMLTMLDAGNPVVWLIGIFAFAVAFFLLRGHFTAEARVRRRREKSHRRVISRKHGPTVRLAVDVDKPKRGRKR